MASDGILLTSELGAAAYRAVAGHNNPPEPTPFEACKVHMDDLLVEARNWADGAKVENQAQADEVSRLIDDLRKAAEAADGVRVEEKAPWDEKIDEIQTRYNAYIAGLKAKVKNPGKITLAMDALKATLKPFLDKLEAERQAEAKRVRAAAQAAADAAVAAMRAVDVADLAGREEAEGLISAAAKLAGQASRIENAKPQARGGSRAMGLTRTFTPVRVNDKAAILHYMAVDREAFLTLVDQLAVVDVRAGKHTIPGYEIVEGTKL